MLVATGIEWTTTPAVALSEVWRLAQWAEEERVEEVRLQPGQTCRGRGEGVPAVGLPGPAESSGWSWSRWNASSSQNYPARSSMLPLPLLATWVEI